MPLPRNVLNGEGWNTVPERSERRHRPVSTVTSRYQLWVPCIQLSISTAVLMFHFVLNTSVADFSVARSGKPEARSAGACRGLHGARHNIMSSSEDDEQAPDAEVLGRMTVARHSGADFEANRTGRPRGEQLPGVDVVDAREPERGRAGSSGTSGGTLQQLRFAASAPAAAGAAGKRPADKRPSTSSWCALGVCW